jgi:dTDP-4-amino-4,6-dideoxygalactose transaminase
MLETDATDFVSYMHSNGIAVRRYYTAVHSLQYYQDKYRELNLDFTNSIKDKIVALPIHTIMSDDEVEYLFKTVSQYFGG